MATQQTQPTKQPTQTGLRALLAAKGVWTTKDAAAFINVGVAYYRRNIISLPGHPTPIKPGAHNSQWWSVEMIPFLSDPANLKWPEKKAHA